MKGLYDMVKKKVAPEGRPLGAIQLVRRTWSDIFNNEILTRASAIAFASMMAIVPFLALVLSIAAFLLPDQTVIANKGLGEQLLQHLEILLGTVLPEQAAVIFEEQIARIQAQPPIAVLSVSLAITLWLASNLFASIIDALNRIYGVAETRPYWKLRLIAAFMTILQSIILLLAVGAIFAWPLMVDKLGLTIREAWIAAAVKWLVVFIMVLLSFALTFFVGPDVTQRHKWVTPGSIFGSIVFMLTTYGFRYYVLHLARYDAMYGSLGGVMMVMFWFWLNSLVLLFAAQLNKVFHHAKAWCGDCDSIDAPDQNAEPGAPVVAPGGDNQAVTLYEVFITKGTLTLIHLGRFFSEEEAKRCQDALGQSIDGTEPDAPVAHLRPVRCVVINSMSYPVDEDAGKPAVRTASDAAKTIVSPALLKLIEQQAGKQS